MIVRLPGWAHSPHLYLLPFLVFLFFTVSAYSFYTASAGQRALGIKDNGIPDGRQDETQITNTLEEESLTLKSLAGNDVPMTVIGNTLHDSIGYPGSMASMLDALNIMQSHFFELWQGTWPNAIDWTRAVIGTQVSATLNAITSYKNIRMGSIPADIPDIASDNVAIRENLLNQYFGHITSFYFGENAFDLRTQAYDDMLWVVLGWLESVEFINLHSKHYNSSLGNTEAFSWHGRQFISSFAHRARVFYDLASRGWDTSLCGGGMLWSPYLAPYKNAITNQLFIAASVSMYLYFPGDSNKSPFTVNGEGQIQPAKPNDPKYLQAAVDAYKWLSTSNMTNTKGLYTDGFHIRDWRGRGPNGSIGTGNCDVRDETVYTYNQGVLLSGLRGLWSSTGSLHYLEDGHALIRNVIAATGWPLATSASDRPKWAGIGRNGILEESCDSDGSCSQNGQTFKGIFFHHMTVFCSRLPVGDKDGLAFKADKELAALHQSSCASYGPWIAHNARAAYGTRDHNREFGMWWTPGLWRYENQVSYSAALDDYNAPPQEGSDYRNKGVPGDHIWQLPGHHHVQPHHHVKIASSESFPMTAMAKERGSTNWDPNTRGRGRTVETQSGGLAVLRALFRLVDSDTNGDDGMYLG
ncbi:hypothetical protein MMC14_007519 [Varicellaria rhodocarpa]|nr:hypothetical protein [Varicellaria rhodocarpa]